MSGQAFGDLYVLARAAVSGYWLCACSCGNFVQAHGQRMRSGGVRSCGCLKRGNTNSRKHGAVGSRAYRAWGGMKSRCLNPDDRQWGNYGGRGIRVCERWLGEDGCARFVADMGQPPPGHTLDRRDVNGHYEPGNCRWATPKTQARNRRSNRCVDLAGTIKPVAEWAEQAVVSVDTFGKRISKGWDVERALTTPSRKRPKTQKPRSRGEPVPGL